MAETYFISDLHFGQEKVIAFDGRPFANVKEMNRELVCRWNSRVTRSDLVYILGDFCEGSEEEWRKLLPQLMGEKVLIRGNHDLQVMSPALREMFRNVQDYMEISVGERQVMLCHYPLLFYDRAYDPKRYMLCGHVHLTRENDFLQKFCKELQSTRIGELDSCGQIYNVGCMLPGMDYVPRTLEEIIQDR